MRTVYHFPLCPFSRKLRIVLAERGLPFELANENYWERRKEFANLNPAMQVPVMIENDKPMPDSYAICEYLEQKYPEKKLIGDDYNESSEIRRIVSWFDNKFYHEVTKYIMNEKVIRFYTKVGQPNSNAIRAAKSNLAPHMHYISFLVRNNQWLAGEKMSLADITAAAHISVLDYLGEVPWDSYPKAREWYALMKSRPSFRAILSDRVTGFNPPKHYANPDF